MLKKTFSAYILLSMLAAFFIFPQPALAELDVSAQAAVLIEPVTGKILFEKNKDERLSMASTTKIMTALLTLESGRLEETVTVTDEMVRVEGTSMGLKPGDQVTLDALVYGMLLTSGNDAANAAALVLDGSIPEFAQRMNRRAKEIGMKGTHFVTPSGLDDAEHYTTAYDMALLAREAMKNEHFCEIAGSRSAQVAFGNPPGKRTLSNHNRLLREYEGANGMKTGFTKKSGRCLVSSAQREGVSCIAVTLNAPNDWRDHKNMLDYGFSVLKLHTFSGNPIPPSIPVISGKGEFAAIGAEDVQIPLLSGEEKNIRCETRLEKFVYAPLVPGDVVGQHVFYYNDEQIATVPITVTQAVEREDPVEVTYFQRVIKKFLLLYSLAFE